MSPRALGQRIGRALGTPAAWLAIGALVLAALVGFAGPLIALGDVRPLEPAATRLWIVLVITLIWGCANALLQARRAKADDARLAALRRQDAEAAADVARRHSDADAAFAAIQAGADRARTLLRRGGGWRGLFGGASRLPWYLVLGPAGAGKTQALAAADLVWPFGAPQADVPTGGCDFLISDDAVFLDTAGRFATHAGERSPDGQVWLRLLDLVRRTRPRQPLNGILLVLPAADLAAMSEEERRTLAQALRARLDEVAERLRTRVPVYVVLAKLDRVPGFEDFFESLGTEERSRMCGVPLADPDTPQVPAATVKAIRQGFDGLVRQIALRQMSRLEEEPDPRRRALVFEFPQQLALLLEMVAGFFDATLRAHRHGGAPHLRGVFLTSARQGGATVDVIAPQLAQAYAMGGRALAFPEPVAAARRRPFFLKQIVPTVMLPEARVSGRSTRAAFADRARLAAMGGLAGLAGVVLLIQGWTSYRQDDAYVSGVLAAAERMQASFDAAAQAGTAPSSDLMLRALNDLGALNAARPAGAGGLSRTRLVEETARAAYENGLVRLLLPALSQSLKAGLASPDTPAALRFRQLKLYLALGGDRTPTPEMFADVAPFLAAAWLPAAPGPQAVQDMVGHVVALSAAALPAQPVDGTLVAKARRRISEATLAQVAYDLLRERPAIRALGPWRPADHAGAAGPRALARISGASLWDPIAGLYTGAGLREVLLSTAPAIAEGLAADGWVMGQELSASERSAQALRIRSGVMELYRADYVRVWDTLLADLTATPLSGPAAVADGLAILIGPASPLRQVLDAVASETSPGRGLVGTAGARLAGAGGDVSALVGRVAPLRSLGPIEAIAVHFTGLRDFVRAAEGKEAPIDGVLKAYEPLYRQLVHVAAGGDVLELGPEPQTASNGLDTVIARLPATLQPVFIRIRKQADAALEGAALHRATEIWATTVRPLCENVVQENFPFNPTAVRDAPLADFARLFGPSGQLATFRKTYLKSLVDTTTKPWRWRSRPGAEAKSGEGRPDEALALLERADAITAAFFPEGDAPLARFTLEPRRLDARASAFQFDVGGATLSYTHGPVSPLITQWPAANPGQPASLSVMPEVEGGSNMLLGEGPWGLFRLIAQARVARSEAGDVLMLGYTVNRRQVVIRLTAANARNPFADGLLSEFRCPSL